MEILVLKTGNTTWEEISGYLGCLDGARRKAVMKKAGDTDRINALLSRLLLLKEIEKRTGTPMKKLTFAKGSYGKPYLKDGGLFFSLSHTKGAIAVAFSEEKEIGVDIESREREVNERIYERALSDEERQGIKSTEDFLRIWVKKEAFLKRLGIGITRDMRTIPANSVPDTAAIEFDEFFVGVSGIGAADAEVKEVKMSDLLAEFVKKV